MWPYFRKSLIVLLLLESLMCHFLYGNSNVISWIIRRVPYSLDHREDTVYCDASIDNILWLLFERPNILLDSIKNLLWWDDDANLSMRQHQTLLEKFIQTKCSTKMYRSSMLTPLPPNWFTQRKRHGLCRPPETSLLRTAPAVWCALNTRQPAPALSLVMNGIDHPSSRRKPLDET